MDDAARAKVDEEEQEDGTEKKIVALDEVARPDRVAGESAAPDHSAGPDDLLRWPQIACSPFMS